ncbi:hypothetical protein [Streptosporangium sp. NPDC001681]|uniref:hypothetical protein n=1 Tax=Streptosporangium sp. NPDC001681 TaxID=3154395 RepID=UPI00332F73C8
MRPSNGPSYNGLEIAPDFGPVLTAPKPEEQIGYISRDELFSLHLPGYNAGVRSGLYIALFLLVLELALMLSAFLPRILLRRDRAQTG